MKSKTIYSNNRIDDRTAALFETITKIIEDCESMLVASHVDPDGDALGTQLAFASFLKKHGKKVYLVREDDIPEKYLFLPGLEDINHIHTLDHDFQVDGALVLECPKLSRAGNIIKKLKEDCRIINIDHHQDNENFGEVNWINQEASSVAEMVFEYFDAVGYQIDEPTATQLYTAILTDTGRFRYNSTSRRTMETSGRLIEAGADPRNICDMIYLNVSQAAIKLIGHTLNRVEFLMDGKVCLLSIDRNELQHIGARLSETEGLSEYSLYAKGVEVGILLKEGDDGITRVSLRSRGKTNVAELAAQFGGGGHICAAGCSIEKSLPEAKKEILKVLAKYING